jgi:hypothetical protein
MLDSCGLEESVYSKKNHLKTTRIKDSLYSEVFFIRSILQADVERYSEYITDSVSFRKYVYTYNKGEWIYGEISKDDVLTIYKVSGHFADKQETTVVFDTTKIDTYNISELKRNGIFE